MNIGQKIKELRQSNNLTQEELAEQLGVSYQAISRWETCVTYPDITMLPIIARMFDVTVDYLLDVDIVKKQEEIKKVLELNSTLFNQGKTNERKELLENTLKKYPNSWDIKNELLTVYFTLTRGEDNLEYEQKSIKFANEILNKCVNDNFRYAAMQILILIYTGKKELEKAKEIVNKLPNMIISSDWFWPDVVTGIERIKATQGLFVQFVEMFYSKLITTFGRAEEGKRDVPLLKFKEFLDVVFENGDYGFLNIRLQRIYMKCAYDQARVFNKEKTLEYLKLSYKYLKDWLKMYRSKEILNHSSFLVDRLIDDPKEWAFSGEPYNEEDFKQEFEMDIFDFIRDDSDFKEFIELINND